MCIRDRYSDDWITCKLYQKEALPSDTNKVTYEQLYEGIHTNEVPVYQSTQFEKKDAVRKHITKWLNFLADTVCE